MHVIDMGIMEMALRMAVPYRTGAVTRFVVSNEMHMKSQILYLYTVGSA